MKDATALQQAVLDALGSQARSVSGLAFDMGLTDGAIHSRLLHLWSKQLVTREWRHDRLVWWAIPYPRDSADV